MYPKVTLRTKFLRKDIVLQAHPFSLRITPSVMYVTQEWPVKWPVASGITSVWDFFMYINLRILHEIARRITID